MNDALVARIQALPCFTGITDMAALGGGMTNHNWRVDDRQGSYVVRLGQDVPEHGILRWHELAATRAAHAAGLAPEVVFAAPGILVSRFIDGRTLQAQDLREPCRLDSLVSMLQRCHQEAARQLRGPALTFRVFQVIRDYLARLQAVCAAEWQWPLAAFAAILPALERAVGPASMVFGHNDLLAANWIDDGRRLWLIDWEYAGFNSPLFDLANLSCNNGFDAVLDRGLLQRYYGNAPDTALMRAFLAMRCASALRECLWALVSLQVSTLDVDYRDYARNWCARVEACRLDFEAGGRQH